MEVRDAVKIAKKYVSDVFAEERISDIGLEEVEFEETGNNWIIVIGFRRPFERSVKKRDEGTLSAMFRPNSGYENRWYKSIIVDAMSGTVLRMFDRVLKNAA